MNFELLSLETEDVKKQAIKEVLACNTLTRIYGLSVTEAQAAQLVKTRFQALRQNGRIEFAGGVIQQIIEAFCDSPYLSQDHFCEILHRLVELFYCYKNETLDLIGDEDLIQFMKSAYDGVCQGSLELLEGRELDRLAKELRFGPSNSRFINDIEEDFDV